MGFLELVLVGVGLAMDAFAVSVCKGLSMKKINWKSTTIIALYFGFFQALMPVIGYLLGYAFSNAVQNIDHWIAFVLLFAIGINMIKESNDDELDKKNDKVDFKTMIVLALATSIDALAIGVTFSFLKTNIILAIIIIGIVTFALSLAGVVIGNKFGDKLQNKAELVGGIVLIGIGIKILLEHLCII